MHIHLDLLGGLAVDMFIASMLDAFPGLEAGMLASIDAVRPPGAGSRRSMPHRDGVRDRHHGH